MTTFDRYILRLIFLPLLIALGIALFALLLERFVGLLERFVNAGSTVGVVVKMLTSLVPHYVGVALPAAFFIAVLLAIRRLSRTSELYALQSAGIGLPRLALPILGLALVLTALGAYTLNYLQPHARYAYRAINFSLTSSAWNAALESGSIFTGFPDKTVLIDGVAEDGREFTGIFIHDTRPAHGSTTITASRGQVLQSGGELGLAVRLYNGIRLEAFDGRSAPRLVDFDQFDVPLDQIFEVEDFHVRGKDEEELTLGELFARRRAPPEGVTTAQIDAEINTRLVRTLTILVLPFLAIPFGVATRRGGQAIGLAIAVIVLVAYHHLLQFGHSLAAAGAVSPLIGLWLPFAAFTAFSLVNFRAASARPEHTLLSVTVERVQDVALQLRAWLTPARRARS